MQMITPNSSFVDWTVEGLGLVPLFPALLCSFLSQLLTGVVVAAGGGGGSDSDHSKTKKSRKGGEVRDQGGYT